MTDETDKLAVLLDRMYAAYPSRLMEQPRNWSLHRVEGGWQIEAYRTGDGGRFATAALAIRYAIEGCAKGVQERVADRENQAKESRDLAARIERMLSEGK